MLKHGWWTLIVFIISAQGGAAEPQQERWIDFVRAYSAASQTHTQASCDMIAENQPARPSIADLSEKLLQTKTVYELGAAGEGPGHLDNDPTDPVVLDCTVAVEKILSGWTKHEVRYMPDLENRFFGRNHFYETQWRSHMLNQNLATDVTMCVQNRNYCVDRNSWRNPTTKLPGSNIEYNMDAHSWHEMLVSNLAHKKQGALLVDALGLDEDAAKKAIDKVAALPTDELKEHLEILHRDWPDWPDTESASGLAATYRTVIHEMRNQMITELSQNPVKVDLPCAGIRGFLGALTFKSDRDFPQTWRKEGQSFLIAFLTDLVSPGERVQIHVHHQGIIVFHDKHWLLRHALPTVGFVEEDLDTYLARKISDKFVGFNLLSLTEF